MKDVKVFIACHKACEVSHDPLYLPMQVGAAGKESIGFQRDDEGDNISEKNPLYCELTGLYWCWKNLDSAYLGLCHYRRYFALKKKKDSLESVLTLHEADELLGKYRILVPKKRHYYIETIYKHYSHTFSGEQLDQARVILSEKYPEYVYAWDTVMGSTSAYVFNMFIMDRELVNSYCAWLFDVLKELEKKIDTSEMTPFEKRYIGRVSERLFNAWLVYQTETGKIRKEEIHEIPYIYFGKVDWPRKIYGFVMAKFFHKKYERSF